MSNCFLNTKLYFTIKNENWDVFAWRMTRDICWRLFPYGRFKIHMMNLGVLVDVDVPSERLLQYRSCGCAECGMRPRHGKRIHYYCLALSFMETSLQWKIKDNSDHSHFDSECFLKIHNVVNHDSFHDDDERQRSSCWRRTTRRKGELIENKAWAHNLSLTQKK